MGEENKVSVLSDDSIAALRGVFNFYDRRALNCLPQSQLLEVVQSLGIELDQQQLQDVVSQYRSMTMSVLDSSASSISALNAALSFQDFVEIITRIKLSYTTTLINDDAKIEEAFKMLGPDSNGYISVSRLRHILCNVCSNPQLTPTKVDDILLGLGLIPEQGQAIGQAIGQATGQDIKQGTKQGTEQSTEQGIEQFSSQSGTDWFKKKKPCCRFSYFQTNANFACLSSLRYLMSGQLKHLIKKYILYVLLDCILLKTVGEGLSDRVYQAHSVDELGSRYYVVPTMVLSFTQMPESRDLTKGHSTNKVHNS